MSAKLVVVVQRWGAGFRTMLKTNDFDNGAPLVAQRLLRVDLEDFLPTTDFGSAKQEATLFGTEYGLGFNSS